jgi:hypothetical protein
MFIETEIDRHGGRQLYYDEFAVVGSIRFVMPRLIELSELETASDEYCRWVANRFA